MELVLNMKNTKNNDGQEKLERQLTILKQCFEDRLSELRKENKHLRENASKMLEDRVCSICFDNRLNRYGIVDKKKTFFVIRLKFRFVLCPQARTNLVIINKHIFIA